MNRSYLLPVTIAAIFVAGCASTDPNSAEPRSEKRHVPAAAYLLPKGTALPPSKRSTIKIRSTISCSAAAPLCPQRVSDDARAACNQIVIAQTPCSLLPCIQPEKRNPSYDEIRLGLMVECRRRVDITTPRLDLLCVDVIFLERNCHGSNHDNEQSHWWQ